MTLFELVGKIVIENQDANERINDTVDTASGAGDRITGAFKKIGGAVATFFAADKIKDFGLSCINAVSDANAASSQFTQVFGDLESQASGVLAGIADSAGISENRMKESFTRIASFAKVSGMDTESALGLSERALIAVADSAAFYDRSLEETTESLQSFLKGNFENDAALGLSCTETTRNAAANELYGKSFKDLSESQKQLTLLKMVEDANAASGALGQAARESDTWTNQTGNLKQAWSDLQAVLGSNILPAAINAVKGMVTVVENWTAKLPELINWCKEHETVLVVIAIAAGTLAAAIGAYTIAQNAATIATTLTTAATTAFGTVMAFVTSPITLVVAAIGALIAIGVALYKNWDVIKEKCAEFGKNISEKWNNLKENVSNKAKEMGEAATERFQAMHAAASEKFASMKASISLAVSNASEAVTTAFNNIKSRITDTISTALTTVQNKFSAIKEAITGRLNEAWGVVQNIIEKIKSAFDFDFKLNIKLPRVKVDGGEAPWGIGGKGKLPSFSVEWFAKAMDNAMVLSDPTIFGYSNGKMLGAGEAGNEVVAGESHLMNLIGQVVENKTAAQNNRIIELLTALLDAMVGGNEEMVQALMSDRTFTVGEREFARLVRSYA